MVDDLVPGLGEVGDEGPLELVCRVVAADVDAHVRPWVRRRSREVSGSGARAQVEDRAPRPGPLQLEEAGGRRPRGRSRPTAWRRASPLGAGRHDGAEEGDAVDGDDRGADVGADEADRALVTGPQRRVVALCCAALGQLGGQARRPRGTHG